MCSCRAQPGHLPLVQRTEPSRALERVGQNLSALAESAGVTFLTGPLHLEPGHRSIAVVEAPNVEAVAELVYDTGLSQ